MNVKLSNQNRPWELEKYIVNGIDSTDLINNANLENYKKYFLKALLPSVHAGMPECYHLSYDLNAQFAGDKDIFRVRQPITPIVPNVNNGSKIIPRNMFMPEGVTTDWKIKKFHNGKFVLTCKQKNTYYMALRASQD